MTVEELKKHLDTLPSDYEVKIERPASRVGSQFVDIRMIEVDEIEVSIYLKY